MRAAPNSDEVRFGHYRLLDRLGGGAGGQVYRALDSRSQRPCAIKLPAPRAEQQLRREYELGARLAHPNIVAYRQWLQDDDGCGLCMDLVDGEQIAQRAEGADASQLRAWLWQLTDALRALHLAGYVHSDVKSEHVLVSADGQVTLVDLGIARPLRSVDEDAAGTPGYAAPEVALLDSAGPEADWYSLGAVLYELLTGELPAERHPPHALAGLSAAGVDPGLASLCRDLLRAEAAERPSGRQVARRLGHELEITTDGHWSVSVLAGEAPFVGREAELQRLRTSWQDAAHSPCILRVHGVEGVGKRSLVRRFLRELPADGRIARIGPAAHPDRPFAALQPVVDQLVALLAHRTLDSCAPVGVREARTLTRMFPRLGGLLGHYDSEPLQSPRAHRDAACGALRALLCLAADGGTLVWSLQGLHDLDRDSHDVLVRTLTPTEACPALPLLLVVASGPSPSVPGLAEQVLELGPLSTTDARHCAAGWLGRWVAPCETEARGLIEGAGGLPLWIEERVRYRLFFGSVPSAQRSYGTLVRERVQRLPEGASDVLGLLALSERPLSRRLLWRATGTEGDALERALSVVLVAGLTQEPDDGSHRVQLAHEALRKPLQDAVGPTTLERLRTELQRVLLGEQRREEGGPARLHRARQMASSLAFWRAAADYEAVVESEGVDRTRDAGRLLAELAHARSLVGDKAGAADAYAEAAGAANRADALRWLERATGCYLEAACVERVMETLQALLGRMGMDLTASPARSLASYLWGRGLLAVRRPGLAVRPTQQVPESELARVDVVTSVGMILSLLDPMRGADYQTRAVRWAFRCGEQQRMARALATEGAFRSVQEKPPASGARALLDQARALADEAGCEQLRGYVASLEAIHAYWTTQLISCLEFTRKAEQLLRFHEERSARELATARFHELNCRFLLGDVRQALGGAERERRDCLQRGDLHAASNVGLSLGYLGPLYADDPAGALEHVEQCLSPWAAGGYGLQHTLGLVAELYVAKYRDDHARGWAQLEEHWPQLRRLGLLHTRATRRYILKHVAELHALSALHRTGADRRRHASLALKNARVVAALDPRIGSVEAAFATGICRVALGQHEQAQADLRRCVERADELSVQDYAWRARAWLARLQPFEEGEVLWERVQAWCAQQGLVSPERWSGLGSLDLADLR